ncbi:MAG: hypothetical protein ACP5UH_00885 [Candidatus Micrarchaeia archaeon]
MMDNIKAFYAQPSALEGMLYTLLSTAAAIFAATSIILATGAQIRIWYLAAILLTTLLASFATVTTRHKTISRKTRIAFIAYFSLMLIALKLSMVI